MFYVYVLRSLKNNKRYVGYTSKFPEDRLKEHNNGDNSWTRQNKPFRLIRSEEHTTKTDAMKREKYLKTGHGRAYLDSLNV